MEYIGKIATMTPREMREWMPRMAREFRPEDMGRFFGLVWPLIGESVIPVSGSSSSAVNLDRLSDTVVLAMAALMQQVAIDADIGPVDD